MSDREWSSGDTARQAAFGALMLGDYLQTRKIVKRGFEMNPIIGKRGDRVRPEVYFPVSMALHTLAMLTLPPKYRRIAQGVSLGVQGGNVGRNLHLGWDFKW